MLPYLVYGLARLFGILPDMETWNRQGGNGGPWHLNPLYTICIAGPMLLLCLLAGLTVILCLVNAVIKQRSVLVLHGLGLAVIQLALAVLQLGTVYWTVE